MKTKGQAIDAEYLRQEPVAAIRELVGRYAEDYLALWAALDRSGAIPRRQVNKVDRIGLYYSRLGKGGAEAVVVEEVRQLCARGKHVVLFINDNHVPIEYDLPGEAELVLLPDYGRGAEKIFARIEGWVAALREHPVDLLHAHQYAAPEIVWDILACKLVAKVPYVFHFHGVFSWTLKEYSPVIWCRQCEWLRLCDIVFTMSPLDEAYFRANGVNAYFCQNPIPQNLIDAMSDPSDKHDRKRVLWLARISCEKCPLDAVRVFSAIHRIDPSIRFVLAGGGDGSLAEEIAKAVRDEGLADVVSIPGPVSDPLSYFSSASVSLHTSRIEGWPLTMQESLACGCPLVTYSHPNVVFIRGNPAAIQVAQGDVDAAARAVIELLSSSELDDLRTKARDSMRAFASNDFVGRILDVVQRKKDAVAAEGIPASEAGPFFELLYRSIETNEWFKARCRAFENSIRGLQEEVFRLQVSWPYRTGRVLTWPFRMIRNTVKCCRENGLLYTLGRVPAKFANLFRGSGGQCR